MDSGNKSLVSVIIPIYKKDLSWTEVISLQQAISIFDHYPLIFICPESLEAQEYKQYYKRHKNVRFERFPNQYFKDIAGYTKLLLSKFFYQRFIQFQYLMIYQLDGFVFKDELKEWCYKEYDYIGAPWFTDFFPHNDGRGLVSVGNGGVSLRNVESCIKLLESKRIYSSAKEVFHKYYRGRTQLLRFFKMIPSVILETFGYRNNARYFIENFADNEDHVFGIHSARISPSFKVAPVKEALKFAFECDPEYLYELNGKKLPFCCHAWEKWDMNFWMPFIEKEGYTLKKNRS